MTTARNRRSTTPPTPARDAGLEAARRVFEIEARGLVEAAQHLDHRFSAALDAIAAIRGRVIVSGIGKSGHIARKIAATLASTGTPAFFVHPAEASHGDLGMVTRDDAVIAISNSGETAELSDLIAHSRRFSIPLIGITAGERSALADAADIVLALPRSDEACPIGLAPTTSTTATLVLGDALAVALLERRGFTADDFQLLHPGGKLGKRLLKIADIMHTSAAIPTAKRDEPMADTLLTMTARRLGCVVVVEEDGALAGIITDGDLRRHMGPGLLEATAGNIMTPNPITIGSQALAAEALGIMNDRAITALVVVDNGTLVGLLKIHDILHAGVA